MFITEECIKCLKCLDACGCSAIDIPAGKEYPEIDPYLCIDDCEDCKNACPHEAIIKPW